jgi:hypothetical protein
MRSLLIPISLSFIACQEVDDLTNSSDPLQNYVMERVETNSLSADGNICIFGGTVDATIDLSNNTLVAIDLFDANNLHIAEMVSNIGESSHTEEINIIEESQESEQVQISIENNQLFLEKSLNMFIENRTVVIDMNVQSDQDESEILTGDWAICFQ